MTPIEGETAMIGLAIGNVLWSFILGALFLSRIWRVSTAARPKRPERPEADEKPSESSGTVPLERRGAA